MRPATSLARPCLPIFPAALPRCRVTTLQGQVKQAFEGTAIAIALGASTLPGDKRYAVTVNWGNFRGENAMSLAAQYRVTDYVVLNAGVAAGFAQGGVGSRAGVTFAW